jgi:hypothetical protein
MKVEIRIYDNRGLWFYVEFLNSIGSFYYTESGKRDYMDNGGDKLKTKTQIRRLGKWWNRKKP